MEASVDEVPRLRRVMVTLRKDEWNTLSGLELPLESTRDTIEQSGVDLEAIGTAGSPPYTRGIHSTMYRSRLWTMRQYAGFSSASETNKRFKLLLERGQKGLSVAFDLPTQFANDLEDLSPTNPMPAMRPQFVGELYERRVAGFRTADPR